MSVSAVYTPATVQLHVQTLLDPTRVRVTIHTQETEKRARIPWQVNIPRWSYFGINAIYLSNRFHFAVRLFSYRSQMTSKCGKNRKVGPRFVRRVGHRCSYHILTSSVIYNWTNVPKNRIYLFYIITENFSSKAGRLSVSVSWTRFISTSFHDYVYHHQTQKLDCKADEWTEGFNINTSTEKLTFM